MFSWAKQSVSGGGSTGAGAGAGGGGGSSSHPASNHGSGFGSGSSSRRTSRSDHLSSYLNHPVLKPSTRKVSADDTTYDTVFQTTNGFALILRVCYPADSPSHHGHGIGSGSSSPRAPSMTIHGVRASHDWLDIRMRIIGYPPVASDRAWADSGLKLGEAVYAVIHHLQLNPPAVLEITDANLRKLQASVSGQQRKQLERQQHQQLATPQPQPPHPPSYGRAANGMNPTSSASLSGNRDAEVALRARREAKFEEEVSMLVPKIPESFPDLDSMPLSEMKRLLADNDGDGNGNGQSAVTEFVRNMAAVTTLGELRDSIAQGNATTAESNLAHKERLDKISAEVEELRKSLQVKVRTYRELDSKRAAMTKPPSVAEAMKILRDGKKEAYDASEEMADEWIDSGGANVDAFVKGFLEERTLHHLRASKAERLTMTM